jgi:predicted 3-demethylubiquinone-9 3-methyltransferase (glyoxalase superfamily)
MQKITPCLWFDGQAEEAARFYASIFPNSKVGRIAHYPQDAPGGAQAGDVMTVEFELDGQRFTGLNGGPMFKFNEAISLQVDCKDQADVDRYWERLGEGGEHGPCGWLKDRFGLSWQIVPRALIELTNDPDPARSRRVFAAMMKMSKIDVAKLYDAYEGREAA